MKRCPTCKRTYADDGFTFCLEDGALLSAPFDSARKDPVSTIKSSGPPPTAVLPERKTNADLPPTIAAPTPHPGAAQERPVVKTESETAVTANRKFKPVFLILMVGFPVLVVGIYLTFSRIQRSRCPHFNVSCIEWAEGLATCDIRIIHDASANGRAGGVFASLSPLLAFQPPALPDGTNVSWSSSAGTFEQRGEAYAQINVKGLAGQTITVKATIESKGGCSETVSTPFVVPANKH